MKTKWIAMLLCEAGALAWLAWPHRAHAQDASAMAAQDALQARSLAATCSNCHGTFGVARGEMKNLAGLPAAAIVAQMSAFKAGTLPATVMHQIAKGYSDEQIRLIAQHYAALPAAPLGATR